MHRIHAQPSGQGVTRLAAMIALLVITLGTWSSGHGATGETSASTATDRPVTLAQADPVDAPAAVGVRRALLIGVGDYKFDDVPEARRRIGKKKSFPEDLGARSTTSA